MDIQKLEQLNGLREKGILSQAEFEKEKQKILNAETITTQSSVAVDSFEDKVSDFWHDYGMKVVFVVVIIFGVGYIVNRSEPMRIMDYVILFAVASFVGAFIKEYQKQSKDIKDLHRYANINAVIDKFGTPDDIKKFGNYTKYIFKKSTNGWGHCKYQVDVFTLQNDNLIKHENYYE